MADKYTSIYDGPEIDSRLGEGKTSYDETVQFRGDVAPSNSPVYSSISSVIQDDGSAKITIQWTYTQGTNKAHGFIVRYSHGSASGQTVNSASAGEKRDSTTRKFEIIIPSHHYISLGVSAYYSSRLKTIETSIITHTNWTDYQPFSLIRFGSDVKIFGKNDDLGTIHDNQFESKEELIEAGIEGFLATFSNEDNESRNGSNIGNDTRNDAKAKEAHTGTSKYRQEFAPDPPTNYQAGSVTVNDDQSINIPLTWDLPEDKIDGFTFRYAVGADDTVVIDENSPTLKLSAHQTGHVLEGICEGKYIKTSLKAYITTNLGLLYSSAVTVNIDRTAESVEFGETTLPANTLMETGGLIKRRDAGGIDADALPESATKKWASETGADITGDHTADDTSKVSGRAAGTVKDEAIAGKAAKDKIDADVGANTLEDTIGSQAKVDARLSSTEKTRLNNGMSPDNLKNLENADVSINANGTLTGAGGGQVTPAGIGAETPAGAQSKVDTRLSSTEKTRLNNGMSPDNLKNLENADVSINANGTLSGAGGGQVTPGGIGAETPSGAQTKVDTRLSSAEKTNLDNGYNPSGAKNLENADILVSDGELDDVFDKEGDQYQVKSDVGVQSKIQTMKQINDRGFESREELDEASQEGFMVTFAGERNGAKAGSNIGHVPEKIESQDVRIGPSKTIKDVIGVKPVKRGSALSRICGLLSGAGIGDAVKQNIIWVHSSVATGYGQEASVATISENASTYKNKVRAPYFHDDDNKKLTLQVFVYLEDSSDTATIKLELYEISSGSPSLLTSDEGSVTGQSWTLTRLSIELTPGLEMTTQKTYELRIYLKISGVEWVSLYYSVIFAEGSE